jgi:hypothetical protein
LEKRQLMSADSPFAASQLMDALVSSSNDGCMESGWTQADNVHGDLGLDTGLLTATAVPIYESTIAGTTNSRSDQFTNSTRVAIIAVSSGTVTSTIDVTGLNGMIADVDVTLDITHTWNADLILTLVSPAGTRVELVRKIGGSSDNFCDTAREFTNHNPISINPVFPRTVISSIDGPGRILGQAGPTLVRSGSMLPARGRMQFDAADLAALEFNGPLVDVILHEMGHVLGIGTLWSALNLVQGAGTADPVFVGLSAMAEYAKVAGLSGPTPVPVANTGGGGTRDAHWRESVFDNELLTGFLNGGQANPISRFTIGSLEDIGYSVNYAAADTYGLPSVAAAQAADDDLAHENDGAHGHCFGTLVDVAFAVLPGTSMTPLGVKSNALLAASLADTVTLGDSVRDAGKPQIESSGDLGDTVGQLEDESIRVVQFVLPSAGDDSPLNLVATADPADYTCLADKVFGYTEPFAS